MATRIIDLPQTRGSFNIKGVVKGTEASNFYTEATSRKGNPYRRIKFSVTYEDGKSLGIDLAGYPRDKVYFYHRPENGEKKGTTKAVPWSERNQFKEKGYNLIGMNVGVQKVLDESGKQVNDKKHVVEYDACKIIGENLKDGESVFIRGNLDFSHFPSKNGEIIRSVKLTPSQVSLCAPCNFGDDEYEPTHDFTQDIVFMGIDKEQDASGNPTGRFEVAAKIVDYSSIEDATFYIDAEHANLAKTLRKNLKPYTGIKIYGKISTNAVTETVEEDDCWGEPNVMEKINAPMRREFFIVGAKPSSIDTESYRKDLMEEAIHKIKENETAKADFGKTDNSGDDWGVSNSKLNDDFEDDMANPWDDEL